MVQVKMGETEMCGGDSTPFQNSQHPLHNDKQRGTPRVSDLSSDRMSRYQHLKKCRSHVQFPMDAMMCMWGCLPFFSRLLELEGTTALVDLSAIRLGYQKFYTSFNCVHCSTLPKSTLLLRVTPHLIKCSFILSHIPTNNPTLYSPVYLLGIPKSENSRL